MSLKEQLEKLISEMALTDEQKSKAKPSVAELLTEIDRVETSLEVANEVVEKAKLEIKKVTKESIGRKDTIKDLTTERDELKAQLENNVDKPKMERLEKLEKTYYQEKRSSVSEFVKKNHSDARFEKITDRIVFPDRKDKDGKPDFANMTPEDWSKVSDEDMIKNVNVVNDLEKLEYFATSQPQTRQFQRIGGDRHDVSVEKKIEPARTRADVKEHASEIAKDYK